MTDYYTIDEAYEHLSKEICVYAIKEYREALQQNNLKEIKSIEKFFLSDWFYLLSGINGKGLITFIKQQENYHDDTHR